MGITMKDKPMKKQIKIFLFITLFASQFSLAQKSNVAIIAKEMQAMYVGIKNPINIVSQCKFDSITIENGTGEELSKNNEEFIGEYEIVPKQPGITILNVYANGKIIFLNEFRSKLLPAPQIKIAGKYLSCDKQRLKKIELAAIQSILAGAEGFVFATNYKVQETSIYLTVNNKSIIHEFSGESIPDFVHQSLLGVDIGSKIILDCRVKGPDGHVTSASGTIIVE
jgi:hypothetical protein